MEPPPDRLRVLVVDDDATNRKVVAGMLERLGCAVDVAEDGVVGVHRAARGRYGVIFMDCSMPRMDGYEATRCIRELPAPHGLVPIVALTANASAADRARCLAAGMDLWIQEPVSDDDLCGVIVRYTGWKGTSVLDDPLLDPEMGKHR